MLELFFLRELMEFYCFLAESVFNEFHSLHIQAKVTLICHRAEVPQLLCA